MVGVHLLVLYLCHILLPTHHMTKDNMEPTREQNTCTCTCMYHVKYTWIYEIDDPLPITHAMDIAA